MIETRCYISIFASICLLWLSTSQTVIASPHDESASSDGPDIQTLDKAITRRDFPSAVNIASSVARNTAVLHGEDHWRTSDARQLEAALIAVAQREKETQLQFRNVWSWMLNPMKAGNSFDYDDAVTFLTTVTPSAYSLHAAVYERRAVRAMRHGRYGSAKKFAAEGLKAYERGGTSHPGMGRVLETIGLSASFLAQHKEAESYLRKACDLFAETLGGSAERTIDCKSRLAYMLVSAGRHKDAERFLRDARKFNQMNRSEDHPEALKVQLTTGISLIESGKVVRGGELIRRTQALATKKLGENSSFVASCLGHLGKSLRIQGRYEEADRAYVRSLELFKLRHGLTHMQTSSCLWNVAAIRFLREDYRSAKEFAIELLSAQKRSGGNRNLKLVLDASELVFECDRHLGKTADGRKYEQLLRNGLKYHQQNVGPNDVHTAIASRRLARFLSETGRTKEALVHYDDAMRSFRESVGSRHVQAILCRQQLGHAYRQKGDVAAAIQELSIAADDFQSTRHDWGFSGLDQISARSMDQSVPLLTILLAREGNALEAWHRLEQGRAQRLSDELAFVRRDTDAASALRTVQACLAKDAAMVTWMGAWHQRQQFGEIWACIVRSEGNPKWLPLQGANDDGTFTYEQLERDKKVLKAITDPSEIVVPWDQSQVALLAQERVVPVEELLCENGDLPQVRDLIVAWPGPSDVPLEVLTDKYTISYSPSMSFYARQQQRIIREQNKSSRAPRILAVGDPKYRPTDMQSIDTAPATLLASRPAREVASRRHAPLPGTRIEIEAITDMFRSDASTTLFGEKASESEILRLSNQQKLKSFEFLHFAAHGEANSDVPLQSAILLSQPTDKAFGEVIQDDAVNDGRLTAEQVRTWELDAQLVTLSACETGLGPRIHGEHFIGFSQAFLAAGARAVVVSNWKVRDDATSLLMRRFYQNMLGKRPGLTRAMGKAAALGEAKAWLRDLTIADVDQLSKELPPNVRSTVQKRRKGTKLKLARPFNHPYYWAPFVLIGDRS